MVKTLTEEQYSRVLTTLLDRTNKRKLDWSTWPGFDEEEYQAKTPGFHYFISGSSDDSLAQHVLEIWKVNSDGTKNTLLQTEVEKGLDSRLGELFRLAKTSALGLNEIHARMIEELDSLG